MSGVPFYESARARKLENVAMHCHLSGQGGHDSSAEVREKSFKTIRGMANTSRMVMRPTVLLRHNQVWRICWANVFLEKTKGLP